jgi:nucleoside-diphosphate-sugar epimerase
MNIIFTGHKGLIGHYLKERLEKEGHKIIHVIDIKDGKDLESLKDLELNEKIDLFVHCAAHCKINAGIESPKLPHYNNCEGTFQVLEFCRKNNIPKIINFSSSRVLSKEKNPYTASKLYGEELCKGYFDCYGIKYVTIRPSTVYGPFWDETKRLMHIFIVNALTGKDLEIYGDPETKTLDFTYIDDFVDGIILAIKEDNKEFNISGGEEFNIKKLAEMIIEKTNSKSKIKVLDSEIAQPQKVRLDISEIQKLGYKPKVSLEEGVEKCIAWYKNYMKEKNLL